MKPRSQKNRPNPTLLGKAGLKKAGGRPNRPKSTPKKKRSFSLPKLENPFKWPIRKKAPADKPQPRPTPKGKPVRSTPKGNPVRPAAPLLRTSPPPPESNPVSRLYFLSGLFMLAFVILAIRALDLTVLQRDTLKKRADNQHRKRVVATAHRGRFLDRNGRPLAISLPVKALSVDMDQVENPRQLANQLAPLIDMDVALLRKRLGKARPGSFPVLKRRLPPPAIQKIRLLNNPALFFIPESQRFYPLGEITSHIIGFVNYDGNGVEGLEQAFEKDLQGTPGVRLITRDRLGRPMPMAQTITPAQPGSDVSLTIDTTIQYIAYRTLLKGVQKSRAKTGTVVILDPRNGDILALVNQPGFNPNNLRKSEARERRNRAIMDTFEPGSTFKIFSAAAALDAGVVTPTTIINIHGGKFRVGDRTIRDFHRGKKFVTVSQILQKSSNVGAAKIGLKLGNPTLEEYLYRFGFADPTGVELNYEARGRIPDITHYRRVGLANRSYGYGITATPLQLTAAAAAAINGGLLHRPRLVKGIIRNDRLIPTERREPRRVIKPETSAQLRRILKRVVGPEGTAPRATVAGYTVGGKTGTARKAVPGKGYVRGLYFASFVGFVPADDPHLVIFVGIDEPQGKYYGGQVAAPIFREIAEEVLPLISLFPEEDTPLALPPMREAEPTAKPTKKPKKTARKDDREKTAEEEGEHPLVGTSLLEALESLSRSGQVPAIRGSGMVQKLERDEQGQTRLILE